MSAEAHAPSASEYIVHHLTHWQNKPQTEIVDFSVFNLDSLFFSITLGLLGSFFLWKAARKATSGVDLALFKWEAALPGLEQLPEGSEAPDLPLPSDPASAAVVRILGPDLSATPAFMAWLRKMRSMK